MGLFNIFKKKKSIFDNKVPEYDSGIICKGVNIMITDNIEESKLHLEEDYAKLTEIGIDKIIKDMFLPWFKSEEFKDRDDGKIIAGLLIDDITYNYSGVNEAGIFDFFFLPNDAYTCDMLESVCMELTLKEGEIKFDAWEV